jgi:hypothetical protein
MHHLRRQSPRPRGVRIAPSCVQALILPIVFGRLVTLLTMVKFHSAEVEVAPGYVRDDLGTPDSANFVGLVPVG